MYSVTRRIGKVKQPRGGYINKKQFEIISFDDGQEISNEENIHSSLIGLAIDYLTRWGMGAKLTEAFEISLQGVWCYDMFMNKDLLKKDVAKKNAKKLLMGMKGLDNQSIINACKMVGYDACYRAGMTYYKPVEDINPDQATIDNIRIMVERSLAFWDTYGPVVKDGFTFEGGYTDIISFGDGDYLTADTLWDFKVSKDDPTSKHTLQLLVYYIMGCHSEHTEFKNIKKLGIFNPRKNQAYIIDIRAIPQEIIDEVSREVIGYK